MQTPPPGFRLPLAGVAGGGPPQLITAGGSTSSPMDAYVWHDAFWYGTRNGTASGEGAGALG